MKTTFGVNILEFQDKPFDTFVTMLDIIIDITFNMFISCLTAGDT